MSVEALQPQRWKILGVMCLALVIASLDTLVITMAIPSLSDHFSATTTELQWSVDAYALTFASTLIFMGALADRYGRKNAFVAGLAVFGVASTAAAFAPSMAVLIAARAAMGLGGALIMPSTLAILKDIFPASERAKAMGIWVGVSSLGIPLGPVLGGLLLTSFWWGSVFLLNVPVILIALIGAVRLIPESRNTSHPGLDLPGLVLSIIGAILLIDAVIEAPARGWTSPLTAILFILGAVALVTFLGRDRRASFPMLGRAAYTDRRFSVPLITISSLFFSVFGSLFLLTTHLQNELRLSPIVAGLHLLPLCAAAFAAPNTPKLVAHFGTGPVSAIGPLLAACSMALLALVPHPGSPVILIAMAILGVGIGFGTAPSVDSILAASPTEQAGAGSAVADVAMQGGGALGIAVVGSLATTVAASAGFLAAAALSALGALLVGTLLRPARHASDTGEYNDALPTLPTGDSHHSPEPELL